eukprot:m.60041 g.60041  ORF g.60041 m.60041 type:complete len:95 (+) comp15727_c0_seq1:366-650(+)
MTAIVLIVFGDRIFAARGVPVPPLILQARENVMYYVFMIYFFGSTLSHNMLNSGAFEVAYNGVPVWSKIDAGHLPTWPELMKQFHAAGLPGHTF